MNERLRVTLSSLSPFIAIDGGIAREPFPFLLEHGAVDAPLRQRRRSGFGHQERGRLLHTRHTTDACSERRSTPLHSMTRVPLQHRCGNRNLEEDVPVDCIRDAGIHFKQLIKLYDDAGAAPVERIRWC